MRPRNILISAAILSGVVLLAVLLWKSAIRRDARAAEFEGKAGARALCLAVSEFHRSRGVWVIAGPSPTSIPGPEGIDFPATSEFQQLAFNPGRVRFQYEVRPDGEGRECVARGDPDGDGEISVFTAKAPGLP